MPGSCLVIVNPAAGNGRAGRQWPALSRQLTASGCDHVAVLTQRHGDATGLCRAALRSGTACIVAAGGDGTLNEVVNGFFDAADDTPVFPPARLGVLPLGTGSDFGRTFGIGRGAEAMAALVAGETALVDVGHVEAQTEGGATASRYFVNVADLGLGAEAAHRVNRGSKALGGFVSYLTGAIRAILAHRPREVTLQLDAGEEIHGRVSIVVVANNRYFGGGMHIAPDAQPDDGAFDVLWLAGMSRSRLLLDLLPKVYRGAHLRHPAVQSRRASTVTITSTGRLPLEVDGEPIGSAPAAFRVLPRALRVVVPPKRSSEF